MNDPLSESNEPPDQPKPLSAGEATEFVAQIADLASAGLPLGPGLRAAAAELPRSRLAGALKRVASALDCGQSLEQALAAEKRALPGHLESLVTAGARTGRLGLVLEEFVRFRQQVNELRRKVWRAMAYPLLLLAMLGGVVAFYYGLLAAEVARFREHTATFWSSSQPSVEPPSRLAEHLPLIFVGSLVVLTLVTLVAAVAVPRLGRRLVNNLPLVGALWRLSGTAEWAHLMRILLENQITMPKALRLSAAGIRDADLAAACGNAAARVESGARLSNAISGVAQFGETARPFIAWGESNSSMSAAFEAIASLSMRRLQLRADFIAAIGPPVVFLIVTGVVLLTLNMPGAVLGPLSNPSLFGIFATPRPSSELKWPPPNLLGAMSLVALGCVLFIAIRLVYGRRQRPDQPRLVMRLTGWLLIALGMLGALSALWGEVGAALWCLGLVCWGGAVYRFRRSQHLVQLNLLAVAADCGIPLEPVVRAMAEEEGGLFYMRAAALADRLASGTHLALAIESNPTMLPRQSFVAARIGEVAGAIGPALRTADPETSRRASTSGISPLRASSLVYLVPIFAGFGAYMNLRIAPSFVKIFQDFRQELPAMTKLAIRLLSSPLFVTLWLAAVLVAIVFAVYSALRELGWVRLELPLIGRSSAADEAAVVMRLLAIVVERGAPLQPAIEFLATSYPAWSVRWRLSQAARELGRGGELATSIRKAGLVGAADEAILRAAVRVGNLPWALREAANNGQRRANYRRAALAQILFPILILAMGGVVLIYVVGWFLPLVSLIRALVGPG